MGGGGGEVGEGREGTIIREVPGGGGAGWTRSDDRDL